IPANIHFEEINPYINLKETPFYIVNKLTPWDAPKNEEGMTLPRRAGISSFGFGGANAHIVLEEYIPAVRPSAVETQDPQLIVLSAKNADRLEAYIQSMLAFLEKAQIDLRDFAYTLQVGRDEMPERLALVVSTKEELQQKLGQILKHEDQPQGVYRNNLKNAKAKSDTTGIQTLVVDSADQKELLKAAELWVSGVKVDWRSLHKACLPGRLAIPTYPFARERYWISKPDTKNTEKSSLENAGIPATLHPLVHRNVSTLKEQKFASRFSREESFF